MTPENFAYWLEGFVELTQGQAPNPAQWKSIHEHLNLVFKKVRPKVTETVSVKVDVDTKDAQKSVDDLKKAYEELAKRAREIGPFTTGPVFPMQPGLPAFDLTKTIVTR
jgi:hypothetical protein